MASHMTPHTISTRRVWKPEQESDYYENECGKFRICIIGKAGVGKSTLLSRVFGMDEAGAIRTGGGRHNIYDPIVDENRNSALIIHDSCGFEAGEEGNLEAVKGFVEYRSSKPSLSEQLHCIWYCISLVDPRQLHGAEKTFFTFLREKEIPLVFVLTKYDAFVREKVAQIVEDGDLENADSRDWEEGRRQAQEHITSLRSYLEGSMGYGVKVQEVSRARKDERLVRKLVVGTTAIVKPNLRIVWFRAQGVLAGQKRTACVKHFPERIIHELVVSMSLPFNVFRGEALRKFFELTFHHCKTVWNLPGQSLLFTKDEIQQMFLDASQSSIRRTSLAASLGPLGPLDSPRYVKVGIQVACDLILIFQQLFWATPRRQKLNRGDLRRELDLYKESRIRDALHALVEGMVGYGNSFSTNKLIEIIGKVVEDGCRILHGEMTSSRRGGNVGSLEEPPFAELPGSEGFKI
ncbi:hypothetical protein BCR34DRAFT_550496 [Clohesyomyces aquaticus]|uniref:G domain-containing protein n=1 Tax=Clohesyomyces aquaticus TaxID=1231657 RepID=A0A1Y1Y809_9PLEO|nr:hypothetical protein BCR34DRAFT_550496 [Clohesyomyces aquaticus]